MPKHMPNGKLGYKLSSVARSNRVLWIETEGQAVAVMFLGAHLDARRIGEQIHRAVIRFRAARVFEFSLEHDHLLLVVPDDLQIARPRPIGRVLASPREPFVAAGRRT